MWKRLVVILVPITALLALLAYGFRTNPREISSPLLGRAATPFSLELFDGARFSLADAKGKVVVVGTFSPSAGFSRAGFYRFRSTPFWNAF